MSLFILKDGKAEPFTQEVMVALAGSGWLAGTVPEYERTWVVVDVEPDGADSAFWAGEFAKWFKHARDWKNSAAFVGSDHLPFRNPVHREPFAYVLTLIDLGAILAGEWRGKASWA